MKVAVIGAGWAGCSASVQLARRGHQVHLFESSRTLGGRARQVAIHQTILDNGQHILLGAYRETLALLTLLGQQKQLHRLPLQMCYPANTGGMSLIAPHLMAPLHMLVGLFRATGLSRADKMSLLRFSSAARWMDWELNSDCSVAELLQRFDQTENLTRLMWQPLCVAALNTPIERASAQIFLNVLKDSLGARRAASDMLIPRTDLTTLLPQAAATYIVHRGGTVRPGCAVQSLIQDSSTWLVQHAARTERFDGVIIATPAEVARQLLSPLGWAQQIPAFDYEPITTCYLQYADSVKLERPFFALIERPEQAAWGQFVFDRGQLDNHSGLLAVVVSASHSAIEAGHTELAQQCAKQLASDLQRPELMKPVWCQVITEKRATFSCAPGLRRPSNQLPTSQLLLAGDYTECRYPATLEAAVHSGAAAASLLMRQET